MKYLLIDTNSWTALLHEENEINLSTLEYWVNQEKVVLLIPAALSKEWEKQKKIQFNFITKAQTEALPKLKSFKPLVKLEHNYVEQRIDRIDNLFIKGKHITANKSVLADVTKRYIENRAPFHRSNNNSNSDALILLTSINFVIKTKHTSLVFITNDADDFSDPKNQEILHEDFITTGIEISYFTNIGKGINLLKEEIGSLPFISANQKGDFTPIFYLLPHSNKYSLIDQLYHSLTKYRDQFSFIPTNILVKIFPFKIENIKHNFSYHSSFQINSNNIELVQLFKDFENLKTTKSKVIEDKFGINKKSNREKINKINRLLNTNLIFSVSSVDNRLEADINVKEDNICNCVLCAYNRFDFLSSFSRLSLVPLEDAKETMKHAYVHFQFGNFIQSLKLFYQIYKESDRQKKYLRSFICLYNLKRLQRYIEGYLTHTDATTREILGDIEKVTFESHQLMASSDPFMKENIDWIANTEFFDDSFHKIVNVVGKIEDHYNRQLSGGWSTNSNFHILVSEFGEIECFLDQNSIIYNNYSEFEDLVNKFLEGLLMLYSLDERQSQRLSALDVSFILLIAKFAKRETIIKHFNRIHLSNLKYVHSSKNEPDIEQTTLRLLLDYKKFKMLFGENDTVIKHFFWEKYKNVFSNLILFITISDSVETDYNLIFEELIKLLPEEIFLRNSDENIIADFVLQKGQYFKSLGLRKFLTLAISNKKFHEERIFNALKHQILNYHPALIIKDKKTFYLIMENFLYECPKCKSIHEPDILVYTYFILSDSLKKEFRYEVKELLLKDFKIDLYYKLSIHEIIDYTDFFDHYLSLIPALKSPGKNVFPYYQSVAGYRQLSELLNLAFKYDIDTGREEFQKYKDISDYYDWLLDMNNFDYNKFDPKWILAYKTESYLNKTFKNEKVNRYMKEYLKKNKHPRLLELYIAHS